MFPVCCLPTADEISHESYGTWETAGISEPGGCWTRSTSEFPSAADGYSACSLRDVLESDTLPKYSLSPRACRGILRRAEKRGRTLPAPLEEALRGVAGTMT
jgi:hypothetical protein